MPENNRVSRPPIYFCATLVDKIPSQNQSRVRLIIGSPNHTNRSHIATAMENKRYKNLSCLGPRSRMLRAKEG